MDRRTFIRKSTAASAGLAVPFVWVPNAHAQAIGEVRDQLIEAQNGTFNATNMDRLLARANAASGTLSTGASAATITESDDRMARSFPNDSRSDVFGAGRHAIFYRFSSDFSNGCAAWCYGDRRVTLMEGPILVCLAGCMEDFREYSINRGADSNSAGELTRDLCAPVQAQNWFEGNFQSVSGSPDIFTTEENTRIEINYSRQSSASSYGEGVYSVYDEEDGSLVYEGSRSFRLLA